MASDTALDGSVDEFDTEAADVTDTDPAETDSSNRSSATSAVRTSPVRRAPTSKRDAGAETTERGFPFGKVAVGIVMAALIACTGFLGYEYFADDTDQAGAGSNSEVLAVANDYAAKLASFDYRDLNKNRSAIAAMSTKEFGAKYDEMVKALTEIVANGQGEATAEVSHSAVESMKEDTATVLLFADQKAKNVISPEGRDQSYRMVVTLKKVDGAWLVDDVQTV